MRNYRPYFQQQKKTQSYLENEKKVQQMFRDKRRSDFYQDQRANYSQ